MIVGLMLARSEAWCLGLTLRAACVYCDVIVFTDHRSDDATPDIVREIAKETGKTIDYRRNDDERWDEMDVRQEQLNRGRSYGASHFVIVDADELPTANVLNVARSLVGQCPPGEARAFPMVAPYHSIHTRRIDGVWGRRSRLTWCFADAPELAWKAADGYQHHMRVPHGCKTPRPPYLGGTFGEDAVDINYGGIFHLQFAARHRLVAKAVWYKIMETIRWPGRMTAKELNKKYDWALKTDEDFSPEWYPPEHAPIPDEWWSGYIDRGWHRYLNLETEAWQAREARRLYAEHTKVKPKAFDGLDLYDVIERTA